MVGRFDLSISGPSGEYEQQVTREATELVDNGKWHLCVGGAGLERHFKFRTFKATWEFMNEVAEECKQQKHHPEWTNIFNRTSITWTTHTPHGMSTKDTHMARFCDEAAERHGEQYPDPADVKKESGSTKEAADCCGQKKGNTDAR